MQKQILILISILTTFLLLSCAGVNDALTPSLSVSKDPFDDSKIISQPSVSASSSLSEGWHTLGFEWSEKYPDVIFLNVGVSGITNVMGVAFNVDGVIIENIKEASVLTAYGDWSTRRLVIPVADFSKIAQGKVVKMKVNQTDTYTVSTFGSEKPGAIVNTKFATFLQTLKENNVAM